MKNTNIPLKIAVLTLMAGLYSTAAVAEVVDGEVQAVVVQPLIIDTIVPMNFTNIASGSSGGTLVMDNTGAITPTGDANVIGGGGGTPLGFNITGENLLTATVSVSGGLLSNGTQTMAIAMDALPAAGVVTLTGAAQSITLGGTLTVGASQAAGTYTTNAPGTPIVITANYD